MVFNPPVSFIGDWVYFLIYYYLLMFDFFFNLYIGRSTFIYNSARLDFLFPCNSSGLVFYNLYFYSFLLLVSYAICFFNLFKSFFFLEIDFNYHFPFLEKSLNFYSFNMFW